MAGRRPLTDDARDVRPLVLRWGSFGDMIMMTPVIEALAKRAGQPVDLIAAGPWSETMFNGSPFVNEVWTLKHTSPPHWLDPTKRSVLRQLRRRPVGPLWVFDDRPEARKFCDATGWPMDAIVYPEAATKAEMVEHAVDSFWRIARIVPPAFDFVPLSKPPSWRWLLPPPDGAAQDCKMWLDGLGVGDAPVICMQIGNRKTMRKGSAERSSNPKNWATDNWLEVQRALRQTEPDAFILLCGAPSEAAMTEVLAQRAADPRIISVARDMTILRLLGLLQRARGLVSVDTGTAHAAAATGCPAVVMFAPSDPRTCGPMGERIRIVCPRQRDGFDWQRARWEPLPMSAVRPDEVIAAWEKLMSEDPGQQASSGHA